MLNVAALHRTLDPCTNCHFILGTQGKGGLLTGGSNPLLGFAGYAPGLIHCLPAFGDINICMM